MSTYVAFDTETTGIIHKPFHPGHIIEIAAVRFRLGHPEPLATFQSLVNPQTPITWSGSQITDEQVHHAEDFATVFPRFASFVGESPLVAHNATFDYKALWANSLRDGVDWPGFRFICTLDLAKKRLPGLKRHRLGQVAQHLHIDSTGWHRALADSHMVRQIFQRLNGR